MQGHASLTFLKKCSQTINKNNVHFVCLGSIGLPTNKKEKVKKIEEQKEDIYKNPLSYGLYSFILKRGNTCHIQDAARKKTTTIPQFTAMDAFMFPCETGLTAEYKPAAN